MIRSIPETTQSIQSIAEVLADRPDGSTVSWLEIEKATGISMRTGGPGREWTRRALRKIRRPYEAVRGNGVRLSAPTTALTISGHKFVRIDGAVRIAERVNRQLSERHLDKMTGEEQRTLIAYGALFGTIRAVAKQNKPLIARREIKLAPAYVPEVGKGT